MKLTIIADDGLVVLDGQPVLGVDLSSLDPAVHAVQFYGEFGEVEYRPAFQNGVLHKPQNRPITDVSEFQAVIDAYLAEKAQQEAEAAAAAATAAAAGQPVAAGVQTL